MQLKLYNSLTHKTETFTPIDPENKVVTFYSCGPTVYDYAHIGNFRAFLNADVLRRTLEAIGYEVKQVMNITDVGHMTEDTLADGGGEDKMEVATARLLEAKKSGTLPCKLTIDTNDPLAVAEFYASAFIQDAKSLGIRMIADAEKNPELMPRPTQYIPQMISMVEILIEKGNAYVASDGVVYFDVESFSKYGELSGNTLDALRSGEGGRVNMETQAVKKNPADFMLWKPDKTHMMRWPSPWGDGYPGWHLECSSMATELLGEVIDIHSGGEDNIFPHHECEIAQSCCATGKDAFAHYWFHTRFLLVDGTKMSKSKGNFYTLRDLVAKGATPAAIRLELIRTNYCSNANFTMQGLKDSQRQINRWRRLANWLCEHSETKIDENGPMQMARNKFIATMCEDLNVSGAIGFLNEAVSAYSVDSAPKSGCGRATLHDEFLALQEIDSILGVLDLTDEACAGDLDVTKIDCLIASRLTAREEKDWARADEIRDELLGLGITIKDGAQGTTWSRTVQ
ncbi:MAG: cysteine--tRNA ligase [Phycisphaerae bacterium]|nr:cysteine--tRNA ligase [Phycisphaerae bacterium]|tara:strand:- start:819 stop:2354 length:1536 start_codon:yes stop_codon:yes gene_type:complete